MITDVFLSLLEISISTGIIIIIVFLFSSLINKRYTMKWKYLIWMILAVRLMIPFNLNVPNWQYNLRIPYIGIQNTNTTDNSTFDYGIPFTLPLQVQKEQINLFDILSFIWLAGVVTILLFHFMGYWNYKITILKKCVPVTNKKYLEQVGTIAAQLKVNKKFDVVIDCNISSPMIIGFFHSILVLPQKSYSENESYFILKHELIHLKRNDVFYKLLLVVVHALHWYNPVVYLLKKEASFDLELFCDEEVVKGANMTSKRMYTEVLMSTLQKQLERRSAFSTQFNGGTIIMKKRFINILNRRKKKSGGTICFLIIVLTLLLGTLVACTPKESSTSSSSINKNDIQDTEQESSIIYAEETEVVNKTNNNDSSTTKEDVPKDNLNDVSNDAKEIEEIVKEFSSAYFGKNEELLATYLSESFHGEIEVYQADTEAVSDITIKGLADIQDKNVGDICVASVEFKQDSQADSYQYLTIELQKESTGWKIYFYGVEM